MSAHPIPCMLACSVLVMGCSQSAKPSPFQFVEWVQVDGVCQEDHANEAGHYSGELVDWRNKSTGASSRYGSVINFDSMDVNTMAAEIRQPYRYHPPFSVDFNSIAASDFDAQAMVLHGVSDDPKHGGGYAATCHLTVQRRLDHLPTDKERQQWVANREHPSAG